MKTDIAIDDFMGCPALTRQFSQAGLAALFEYLADYERDSGAEVHFDPVAIRCDFSEYSSLKEAFEYLDLDYPDRDLGYSDELESMLDALRSMTVVIIVGGGGVILQDF